MTPRLAALVKRVVEIRAIGLWVCHYTEKFTLRQIHRLGRQERLAYDCPWLADSSHEPAAGRMFNLHF
jgi:hypothetical protein